MNTCFHCEMSLALTLSMSDTVMACRYARLALNSAAMMGRPDLMSEANDLLSVLGRFV